MSVDDLCDSMSFLIPLHEPEKELSLLQYSSTVSIDTLANLEYLNTCHSRYARYLKYINFERYYYINGYSTVSLINEFLSYKGSDFIWLAKISVEIDRRILNLINFTDSYSDNDEEEGFFEV